MVKRTDSVHGTAGSSLKPIDSEAMRDACSKPVVIEKSAVQNALAAIAHEEHVRHQEPRRVFRVRMAPLDASKWNLPRASKKKKPA
jgi:hypothetical protein